MNWIEEVQRKRTIRAAAERVRNLTPIVAPKTTKILEDYYSACKVMIISSSQSNLSRSCEKTSDVRNDNNRKNLLDTVLSGKRNKVSLSPLTNNGQATPKKRPPAFDRFESNTRT